MPKNILLENLKTDKKRFLFLNTLKDKKKKEKNVKEKIEKFRVDTESIEQIIFCMQYFKGNKSEMIRSAIKLLFNTLKDIN